MFRNFLILAYRNFKRSPLTSFIELFGMTVALTVFLIVLLWVFHETGYDKFNENYEQIYRLEISDSGNNKRAILPTIVAPIIKESIPEIESIARVHKLGTGGTDDGQPVTRIYSDPLKTNYLGSGPIILVDNEFFNVFTFEFIAGDPKTALIESNTTVITESLAKKIFGNESPMNQTIKVKNFLTFRVTGVIKDQAGFHIPFQMLRSLNTYGGESYPTRKIDTWDYPFAATYVLLNKNSDIRTIENKIVNTVEEHRPKGNNDTFEYSSFLRPLVDIYFKGHEVKENGYAIHGDRKKMVAYILIGIFTLLLACINFINLNSAKSLERAKEVGIKKVAGGTRIRIFIEFLGEVIILCNIALVLALLLIFGVLPHFNDLMNTSISLSELFQPTTFLFMVIGLLLISLFSGGFPALYMSSFKPALVLKGLPSHKTKGLNFKKINLTVQFAVTIILIIGSITVFKQIDYMKNADLGFKKEHLIDFIYQTNKLGDIGPLKRILLDHPNILNVSSVMWVLPGSKHKSTDRPPRKFMFNGREFEFYYGLVDEDYVEILDLEMLSGRFFEKGRVNDFSIEKNNLPKANSIVINETAAKILGLENTIGVFGKSGSQNVQIIGVLKDFHLNSLNEPIVPMVFYWYPFNQTIVKLNGMDMASTLKFIDREVKKATGEEVLPIRFLDEEFDKNYRADESFALLMRYFTFLAILIACMGLFGVAIHTIKLRLKEIGVRKTLGASSLEILNMLSFYFLKILFFAMLIAIPIAWLAMNNWLNNYAYRIELTVWVFVVGSSLTVLIALMTILYKSWQASILSPVKLIKYE